MKGIFVTGAVLLILASGCFWATPYLSIISISNALIDRDSPALTEHVDFPTLKQNLKDQSNDWMVVKDGPPESQKSFFSSIGRMIGAKLVHKVIDSAVTPEGMIAIAGEVGLAERSERCKSWWRRTLAPFVNGRCGYDSLSRFSYLLPTDEGDVRFVLQRTGLRWRLTNAVVPAELLKRRFTKWLDGR